MLAEDYQFHLSVSVCLSACLPVCLSLYVVVVDVVVVGVGASVVVVVLLRRTHLPNVQVRIAGRQCRYRQ